MKLATYLALTILGLAAVSQAQSPIVPIDGLNVDIQTVDDYSIATGQAIPIDPNGFDVKVVVTHRGQAVSHAGGASLSDSDAAFLGASVVRYRAILPDGTEIVLPTLGACSASGAAYSHLALEPTTLEKFEAVSNPEISIVASLVPRPATDSVDFTRYPSSRPIRLSFNVSALRNQQPLVSYTPQQVQNLALQSRFLEPVSMRSDEATITGDAPSVSGSQPYYMWMRYNVKGSPLARFAPIAPPKDGKWKADLSWMKPETYRIVVFASPHADTATFPAEGWREDAYAISPESTVTIEPSGFHLSPMLISSIIAGLFLLGAGIMLFRDSHQESEPTDQEQKSKPSFATRAHKFLACILLAIAVLTVINYYEFFTTIVASALRREAITGQDWDIKNSGGISLLIMSYSVSLGLCIELGLYKLFSISHPKKWASAMLHVLWLGIVAWSCVCAFYFIGHIGAFYAARPDLFMLGQLAGMAELVIFFVAFAALMPTEDENWSRTRKSRQEPPEDEPPADKPQPPTHAIVEVRTPVNGALESH